MAISPNPVENWSLRELPTQLDHLLLTVPSLDALYPRLAEFLLQSVEVDGVWLGVPDVQGQVQCHFAAGEGVEEFLAGGTVRIRTHDSPLSLAWRTGEPQFAVDWTDEDGLVPSSFWRERGLKFGWRSSCTIPISGYRGERDVLVLYSRRSHFFAQESIHRFVTHLHGLLGLALERLRLMDELKRNQQTLALYKTAMDASPNGILISDATVKGQPIRYANAAFERMSGYSVAETIGTDGSFLPATDIAQPQLETLRNALRDGEPCNVELKNHRKDGSMFWTSLSTAPVRDETGLITHFIGIQNDITDLKSALGENGRANALYRALMSTAELVIRAQSEREMLDDLCRLLVESKLFPHVWIGRPNTAGDIEVLSIFSTIASDEYWYRPNVHTDDENRIMTVRAWRRAKMQYTNDRLNDPDFPVIQDFYRKHGLRGTAVVPLYRDGELWALLTLISQEANIFEPELLELLERIGRLLGHGLDSLDLRQILEEERQHQSWLARHDPLTDILNRRGITERLEEAVSRTRRHKKLLGVAILDLDGFKGVNDLHGHPAGDLILRTIGERLQATLRQSDAVGRLGGDEFVLILEDLEHESDLAVTFARVQDAVERPILLSSGHAAAVRSSIGVTLFPCDNSGPDRLLRHADRALYALKESKEEPDQRWMLFHAEADEKKFVRQKTILSLFRAGNVRVHYQPVIDLQNGRVWGVEALARLADSDDSLLAPADFIPQLGAADLVALTQQVLARSVKDMHHATQAGFRLNVGINLEPAMLADAKAMQDLCAQIEASGLGPGRIVLELLERADTLSVAGSQRALRDLKAAGARIALDDVGSAYSSLLRVKELPVDIIKLDRSFLVGLERQPKELRFVMSLVHLVLGLGLGMVAEGIESDAARDALAALDVRHGQGYAIARPMPLDDLLRWLRKHKPVPWERPTTVLGAVARQLCGLDATARILPQRPGYLQYMQACDPDKGCEIGSNMSELGPIASRAAAAHRAWHATIASLSIKSGGPVDPADFKSARALYEEELFQAALNAHPPRD
ncbi:MAG: EAL domain-containing protein [Acidobacteriaceae bacterium]